MELEKFKESKMKNIFIFLEVFLKNDIKKGCSKHCLVLKTSYICKRSIVSIPKKLAALNERHVLN